MCAAMNAFASCHDSRVNVNVYENRKKLVRRMLRWRCIRVGKPSSAMATASGAGEVGPIRFAASSPLEDGSTKLHVTTSSPTESFSSAAAASFSSSSSFESALSSVPCSPPSVLGLCSPPVMVLLPSPVCFPSESPVDDESGCTAFLSNRTTASSVVFSDAGNFGVFFFSLHNDKSPVSITISCYLGAKISQ